jgi:hypothetical protein
MIGRSHVGAGRKRYDFVDLDRCRLATEAEVNRAHADLGREKPIVLNTGETAVWSTRRYQCL